MPETTNLKPGTKIVPFNRPGKKPKMLYFYNVFIGKYALYIHIPQNKDFIEK